MKFYLDKGMLEKYLYTEKVYFKIIASPYFKFVD